MIHLDEKELRKLQLIELEALIEVDRICRKNNIRYTLTGGTLLGAVRHGGFIPWDDDADISMLRSEYERFREACLKDLDESRFYFQDMSNTPGYRWGYGKLRRKNTVFLREYQEDMPYEQGVFIDIFPRDGVPDGKVMRNIHKFLCFCVRKVLWSAVGRKADKRTYMRIWYAFIYRCIGDKVFGWYKRLVKFSNRNKTELVRALTFPVPHKKDGYRREWYEESVELTFENHLFMANKEYKNWLEAEFGDYMQLPPIEKRKVHPVSEIKLE